MEKVTIKLKKPIVFGEDTIEELEVREPDAGDLRGLKIHIGGDGLELNTDDILTLASRCCAQPVVVINKLSLADMGEVTKAVINFIAPGLLTGLNG